MRMGRGVLHAQREEKGAGRVEMTWTGEEQGPWNLGRKITC